MMRISLSRSCRIAVCCVPALVLSLKAAAQQQTTDQLKLPQGQVQTQSEDKRWRLIFDSDARYFNSIQTSPTVAGYVATQYVYVPLGFQLAVIPNDDWKVEFGVRGGRVDLNQRSSSGAVATFSGWTDTTVNGTLTYYGFDGFQPFASLSLNLPTGTSLVSATVANVPQDPDITQVKGFGEGFNVGPTIGVNIPMTADMLLTFSVGHTIRGDFQRAGPALGINQPGFGLVQNVSPGAVTTLNASFGYESGAWSYQASANYAFEQTTLVDGSNFIQTGGRFGLSAALGYAWTEQFSSKASFAYTHTGPNLVPANAFIGNFGLQSETFNSNSDTFNIGLDSTYRTGAWSFGPSFGFFYRDHNGYDVMTSLFVPAKSKWSAAGTLSYAFSDSASLRFRGEHYWVNLNESPGTLPTVPVLNTDGWLLSLGGKIQF